MPLVTTNIYKTLTGFTLWFTEGFWHIVDINAYDHILFLLVLFGSIGVKEWKKMLWLITAFTIGHSITLALSVLHIVKIRIYFVELLIPCTILATAIYNLLKLRSKTKRNIYVQFFMTLFFGTIHGLGFSQTLRSLLRGADNIPGPLFSFNLGIEAGQLIIIGIIFIITLLITKGIGVSSRNWRIFLSAGTFIGATVLTLIRI